MAATIDLNDDTVVVVIGSGAGGGTLGTELALKGIRTVVLEAGPRVEKEEFENDEWSNFVKISWLDSRTTSGSWRVAKDFAGLPAWIVKAVGGSTVHWAGASLRIQEHEFKARTTYGDIAGASLLDWPIGLADLEPYYDRAEDRMGVTRTHGIPGLPGNNNFKVMKAGADKLGYKNCHTGRMAITSEPRDGRASCQQLGFCFQGCKVGAKWSTLYSELPKGEATGHLEVRPNAQVLQIEHDDGGKVTGVVYADAEGVIRFWNRGATRIFGFAEAEAIGQSLDIIIPERLRARHWKGFRATMQTGQSRYGEGQTLSVPALRKDGAQISVEFTIVPFTDESGQMVGIAAVMRDTTARFDELRNLRRQLASLAPKP